MIILFTDFSVTRSDLKQRSSCIPECSEWRESTGKKDESFCPTETGAVFSLTYRQFRWKNCCKCKICPQQKKKKIFLVGKKLCIHNFNRGKSFVTLLEKRSKPFFCCSGNHIHHLYQIKTMKRKAITTHLPYSSPINFLLNISSDFPK